MLKRIFDIILSLIGLITVFPFLLLIAALIKRESKGPVFFRGERIGKWGEPFKIFKFRTMIINADKLGGPSTASDDPRLTNIGKFLKKYQLDELPQLIDVLRGKMSLVGPRPEVPFYVNMMTKEEKETILSILPGMTDLASLFNFHEGEILKGSSDPEKTYQEKIRPTKLKLQMEYVKNRSCWLDLKIIFRTIMQIFR